MPDPTPAPSDFVRPKRRGAFRQANRRAMALGPRLARLRMAGLTYAEIAAVLTVLRVRTARDLERWHGQTIADALHRWARVEGIAVPPRGRVPDRGG